MFWHWPPLQPASQTHLQSGECYLVVLLSAAMLRSSLQLLTSCSDTGRAGRTRGCTAAAAAGARSRPRYPRTRAPRGPPPRTPRPASRACTRSGPPRRSRGPSSRGPGSRAPGTTGPCNPANIFRSITNIFSLDYIFTFIQTHLPSSQCPCPLQSGTSHSSYLHVTRDT